ncbi:2-oxoacid:acceptor oxidoreductase family protein [Candidatus Omnitrophota bacterium]
MKEIKIYARAGQGAITTATILGQALFQEGKYPYAFPHFGAARMGAPMNAFVRVDDKPIRLRSQIYEPDYVIIVDATLMRGFDCLTGLQPEGVAVFNEREGIEIPKSKGKQKIYAIPANKIAMEVIGLPLGNTTLIGAFAAATGEMTLDAVHKAINDRFKGKLAEVNAEAAKRGFEYVQKADIT